MSIRFIEGFGSYAGDGTSANQLSALTAKFGATSGSPTLTASPPSPRYSGMAAVKLNAVGASLLYEPFVTAGALATPVILGFSVYFETLPTADNWITGLFQNTGQGNLNCGVVLRATTAGAGVASTLEFRNGSNIKLADDAAARFALSAGTWYYIEYKYTSKTSMLAGDVELRVNGVKYIGGSVGVSSQFGTSTGGIGGFRVGPGSQNFTAGTTDVRYYSDIYFKYEDGTGTAGFLGDCRVETLRATAAGTTQDWTPLNGTPNTNFANVSGAWSAFSSGGPLVCANTVGVADTFVMGDLSSIAAGIYAVSVTAEVNENDSVLTHKIGSRYRIGGVNYTGKTLISVSGSNNQIDTVDKYAYLPDETSPATGAAWTVSEVNGMEAGYILVA